MHMELDEFIKILQLKKEKIISFCGAGISRDSGMPGVKEMYRLKDQGKINLDDYKNEANKRLIFWRRLVSGYTYNLNHFLILKLAEHGYFDTIVSSNYDDFFEKCIMEQFSYWKNCDSIDCSFHHKYSNKKQIVKIHGDINHSNVGDFDILQLTLGNECEEARNAWSTVVKGIDSIWVLGYAGKEDDFGFKLMKENKNIKQIYWMYMANQSSADVPVKICKQFGVSDKVKFIKIKDAREALGRINEALFEVDHNEIELIEKYEQFKVRRVDENTLLDAFQVANHTVELLKIIDRSIVNEMQKAETNFSNILNSGDELPLERKLYILRRYNSYTPILPLKDENSKGGGYFLNCNGFGLVIDPGYDFLENFLHYQDESGKLLKLNNIDAVIITHAHNDHYGELDDLQNMLFQYNKRVQLKGKLSSLFKKVIHVSKIEETESVEQLIKSIEDVIQDEPMHVEANTAINLLKKKSKNKNRDIDIDILNNYITQEANIRRIDLYINRSAHKAIDGFLTLDNNSVIKNIYILNPNDEIVIKEGIDIKAIPVKHRDIYSENHAIGIKLRLRNCNDKEVTLGFTGDTGYFIGLENELRECDILIPHIGSVKPKELEIYKEQVEIDRNKVNRKLSEKYVIPNKNSTHINTAFYENHLGILGLCTLISALKVNDENFLKLVIISEYGEEMKSFRWKISEWLNKIFNGSIKILTGDIGLAVDIDKVIDGTWRVKEVIADDIVQYEYID